MRRAWPRHAHRAQPLNSVVSRMARAAMKADAEVVIDNLNHITDGDAEYMSRAAEKAIQVSAYWYGHPHGPARAPKHAERLEYGKTGLEIEFGANTFLVEQAIRRCAAAIEKAAESVIATGDPIDEAELRRQLGFAVCGAVANFDGVEYSGYYDASDGFMHFGTQAVHVASFVESIWGDSEADLLT